MFVLKLLTIILAVIVPAPSPAPREPKTIITVISSPYCKSLAEHFNDALVPMLANDRTLDGVSVQLDDFNTMFNAPNYVQQFLHIRDALGRQETELTESLAAIQREINELRDGSRLTSDPQAVARNSRGSPRAANGVRPPASALDRRSKLIPVDAADKSQQIPSDARRLRSARYGRPGRRPQHQKLSPLQRPARRYLHTRRQGGRRRLERRPNVLRS